MASSVLRAARANMAVAGAAAAQFSTSTAAKKARYGRCLKPLWQSNASALLSRYCLDSLLPVLLSCKPTFFMFFMKDLAAIFNPISLLQLF